MNVIKFQTLHFILLKLNKLLLVLIVVIVVGVVWNEHEVGSSNPWVFGGIFLFFRSLLFVIWLLVFCSIHINSIKADHQSHWLESSKNTKNIKQYLYWKENKLSHVSFLQITFSQSHLSLHNYRILKHVKVMKILELKQIEKCYAKDTKLYTFKYICIYISLSG